jgi:hypothetical protein
MTWTVFSTLSSRVYIMRAETAATTSAARHAHRASVPICPSLMPRTELEKLSPQVQNAMDTMKAGPQTSRAYKMRLTACDKRKRVAMLPAIDIKVNVVIMGSTERREAASCSSASSRSGASLVGKAYGALAIQ